MITGATSNACSVPVCLLLCQWWSCICTRDAAGVVNKTITSANESLVPYSKDLLPSNKTLDICVIVY